MDRTNEKRHYFRANAREGKIMNKGSGGVRDMDEISLRGLFSLKCIMAIITILLLLIIHFLSDVGGHWYK